MSSSKPPHLHRHALESIFGFLPFDELTVATQVSREWRAATLSMSPVHSTLAVHRASKLCSSRLGCAHVSALAVQVELSLPDLRLLSECTPHLTDLGCKLLVTSTDLSIAFPRKLARLVMGFVSHEQAVSPAEISLRALHALSGLRSLTVILYDAAGDCVQPSLNQLDEIRALHWLSSVTIEGVQPRSLHYLLREPHTLPWTRIAPLLYLRTATGELVATLPLTLLTCVCIEPASWLPRLAGTLRELSLNILETEDEWTEAMQLCEDLHCLVHLTRLTLAFAPMRSPHLAYSLTGMPRLLHLHLIEMSCIDSLSFLRAAGVPKLESLVLEGSGNRKLMRNPSELSHVVDSQQHLRSLRLDGIFDLTESDRATFAVPSTTLPLLEEFIYEASNIGPDAVDDVDEDDEQ